MKLIACLVLLSLICSFWLSVLASVTTDQVLPGHQTLSASTERGHTRICTLFEREPSQVNGWWTQAVWTRCLLPHRRRGSRFRKLYRLILRLQHLHRRRLGRWRRLQQEAQTLMAGTSSVKLPVEDGVCSTQELAIQPTSEAQITTEGGIHLSDACTTGQDSAEDVSQIEKRGPGRPREIETGHVCCPHEECTSYGVLGDHPGHDIVGYGTYTTVHGERRQMYLCKVCGQPFSETAGTPFFGLKSPSKTVCIALNELSDDVCNLEQVVEHLAGGCIAGVGVFQSISPVFLHIETFILDFPA